MIKEAEAAWKNVVATVNKVHPSDSLESRFFPLFAEDVTGAQTFEGEKHFSLWFYGLLTCLPAFSIN